MGGALATSLGARTAISSGGDMARLTLAEAGDLIRRRKVSSAELTSACLKRIEQSNPRLNTFITVMAERAAQDAKAADQDIANGKWRGALHGIPVGLKDLFDSAGAAA